jgi:hypothetical protein
MVSPACGYRGRPGWREAELRMWQELTAAAAGGDAGMRSMRAEGTRSLANWDAMHRVFAVATAP